MTARSKSRKWPLWLSLTAALGALAYAATRGTTAEPGMTLAKTGVVLDAQTRQPLSGVYVVARWLENTTQPSLLGGGRVEGQCLYRVVVRTDAQGHYTIPATGTSFRSASNRLWDHGKNHFWDLYTYSEGYAAAGGKHHPEASTRGSASSETQSLAPILLAADHALAEQRVATLSDTLSRFTCEPYSRDPLPIARQVYADAYATACLLEPNDAARALAQLRRSRTTAAPARDTDLSCTQFRQARNDPQ